MQPISTDHYAILGLDRNCTADQIRAAYRFLAKQHHPDVNGGSSDALAKTQRLNEAYAVLSDREQRCAYDQLRQAARPQTTSGGRRTQQNIAKEVQLRIEEFLRGVSLDLHVNDPGSVNGPEVYQLLVPPATAPGARFRVPRKDGGFVVVRVRARPDFRFKVRGSDLQMDLSITSQRAAQGGSEMIQGLTGMALS